MYSEIQALLRTRSKLFCNSQFEELAEFYKLPFVTFHDGVPNIVKDHSQLFKGLSDIAAIMKAKGACELSVEVTSLELPRNGRFRLCARYRVINSWGGVISQTDVTQYLVESSTSPLVEMIESVDCPFAAVWEDGDPHAM